MFERYTEEGKRAIFIAQQIAIYKGDVAIDPSHLLIGLLAQKQCRANTIFGLRRLLAHETEMTANRGKWTYTKGTTIPLNDDGKRVLRQTAREANRLRDYWIDTEHLVLGTLGDGTNASASKLRDAGLELEGCRQLVVRDRDRRPSRPNPVLWWVGHRPIGFVTLAMVLFCLGISIALVLSGFVGLGSGFALLAAFQVLRLVIRGDGA